MHTEAAGTVDPHRPWIRDERDNPHAMNWAQTLFNPMGETSKLHFSRAWTAMFMGRVLLYMVPSFTAGVLGIAGANLKAFNAPVNLLILTVPALLVPFAVFTIVTEFTSFVAHHRRLADARRPTWLAIIVLVPMILGLVCYNLGAAGTASQIAAAKAPKPAAEASATGDAPKADAKAEKPKQQQRRGPPGPPQSERQQAVSAGMGFGLMVWAPLSFGVMLWTLLYVARLPNGGVGTIRTGSDLAEGEAEQGLSY